MSSQKLPAPGWHLGAPRLFAEGFAGLPPSDGSTVRLSSRVNGQDGNTVVANLPGELTDSFVVKIDRATAADGPIVQCGATRAVVDGKLAVSLTGGAGRT